jgi:tripartite-type tricarboxylate transporter receptor subunit TctC
MNINRLFFALAAILAIDAAFAQTYPEKAIRLITGYSVGSQPDVTVRVIVNEIGVHGRLGAPIVIDNRPGANSTIGVSAVVKSAPDGYTLLFAGTTADPVLVKSGAIDISKALDPVTTVGRGQYFLYARGTLPVHTFAELLDYSRAHPNQLNFGGVTKQLEVIMDVLKAKSGLSFTAIPYKVSTQTISAMLTGESDVTVGSAGPLFLPYLKSGAMRAIVCFCEKRSSLLPEAPSVGELGIRSFEASYSVGVWVPKGTAPEIINKLNGEFVSVVKQPDVGEKFRSSLGYEPVGSTPEEQLQDYRREIGFWTEAARLSGFQPQ